MKNAYAVALKYKDYTGQRLCYIFKIKLNEQYTEVVFDGCGAAPESAVVAAAEAGAELINAVVTTSASGEKIIRAKNGCKIVSLVNDNYAVQANILDAFNIAINCKRIIVPVVQTDIGTILCVDTYNRHIVEIEPYYIDAGFTRFEPWLRICDYPDNIVIKTDSEALPRQTAKLKAEAIQQSIKQANSVTGFMKEADLLMIGLSEKEKRAIGLMGDYSQPLLLDKLAPEEEAALNSRLECGLIHDMLSYRVFRAFNEEGNSVSASDLKLFNGYDATVIDGSSSGVLYSKGAYCSGAEVATEATNYEHRTREICTPIIVPSDGSKLKALVTTLLIKAIRAWIKEFENDPKVYVDMKDMKDICFIIVHNKLVGFGKKCTIIHDPISKRTLWVSRYLVYKQLVGIHKPQLYLDIKHIDELGSKIKQLVQEFCTRTESCTQFLRMKDTEFENGKAILHIEKSYNSIIVTEKGETTDNEYVAVSDTGAARCLCDIMVNDNGKLFASNGSIREINVAKSDSGKYADIKTIAVSIVDTMHKLNQIGSKKEICYQRYMYGLCDATNSTPLNKDDLQAEVDGYINLIEMYRKEKGGADIVAKSAKKLNLMQMISIANDNKLLNVKDAPLEKVYIKSGNKVSSIATIIVYIGECTAAHGYERTAINRFIPGKEPYLIFDESALSALSRIVQNTFMYGSNKKVIDVKNWASIPVKSMQEVHLIEAVIGKNERE